MKVVLSNSNILALEIAAGWNINQDSHSFNMNNMMILVSDNVVISTKFCKHAISQKYTTQARAKTICNGSWCNHKRTFSVDVCWINFMSRKMTNYVFEGSVPIFVYVKRRRGCLWTNIFMMLIILLSCVPCLKPCVDNFYLVRSCHLIKIPWLEERRIYKVWREICQIIRPT